MIAFPAAREQAFDLAQPFEASSVPLAEAAGCVLAEALHSLSSLPPFDTCSMDGWAVCGQGPWTVAGQLLAGDPVSARAPLRPGEACVVSTGAMIPAGAEGLLRTEHGTVKGSVVQADSVSVGLQDVRRAGREARAGDLLLASGTPVTPPIAGLAAAAGHDWLRVIRRPVVDVLVIGSELLSSGRPENGRVRDSLGVQLPGWIAAGGGVMGALRRLGDDAAAVSDALLGSSATVVVTTGGSARGRGDHVRTALGQVGATILVDGVQLRPGAPMKLARMSDQRLIVVLPGNPLAAIAGVVTLLWPVLAGHAGAAFPATAAAAAAESLAGTSRGMRLMPLAGYERVTSTGYQGSAMLRGLAAATVLGLVPPGGVAAGSPIEIIRLPW